ARVSGIKIVGLVRSGRCEMRQRVVELLAVIAVLTVAALAMSVAGQTVTSAQRGQSLKTSWGEPDLQGLWTREYDVPMQRPAKYKDQEFFTEQQIAELDKVRAA